MRMNLNYIVEIFNRPPHLFYRKDIDARKFSKTFITKIRRSRSSYKRLSKI